MNMTKLFDNALQRMRFYDDVSPWLLQNIGMTGSEHLVEICSDGYTSKLVKEYLEMFPESNVKGRNWHISRINVLRCKEWCLAKVDYSDGPWEVSVKVFDDYCSAVQLKLEKFCD